MALSTGLRVLAISADTRFLREVRLVAPLGALVQAGRIKGFRIFNPLDGGLSQHFDCERFDALLVQRDVPQWVLTHLARSGLPFFYDLDDLLLATPAYSPAATDAATRKRVAQAIRLCRVLGVSTARLLAVLERRMDMPLSDKAVVIPNGLPVSQTLARGVEPPQAVLWTTSDRPALVHCAGAVLGAVRAFSALRDLPILLAGRFDRELAAELPGARFLGYMDYWQHKLFLATSPRLLCVAPLETEADAETLEFIACKSDVKMVEYGGFGHTGVYSHAPPYADTDIVAGRLTGNSRAAWLDSLEYAYSQGCRTAEAEAGAVTALRSMDVVASQCWLPALKAVRLDSPVSVEGLLRRFGGNASSGQEPLHHRLADHLYHGLYRRLVPDVLKRRIGRAVERKLDGEDGEYT